MNECVRKTLLGTEVGDIEVKEGVIVLYLNNEHGACYGLNIKGEVEYVSFLEGNS